MLACERHCCLCGEPKWTRIECHHIIPEAEGGPNTFDNCIPLCFDCHAEVGAYNLGHPKGTKFTAEELRQRRDRWYKEIKNRRTLREPESLESSPIELESFEKARQLAENLNDPENQRRGVVKGWELLTAGIMRMTSVSGENLDPLSPEVSRALKKLRDSTRVPDELTSAIEPLKNKAYSAGTMSRYAGYDPDVEAALGYIAECERVRDQLVLIYNSRGL
jgi:HNH endonuclease